jgi:prevent-host-death family protein
MASHTKPLPPSRIKTLKPKVVRTALSAAREPIAAAKAKTHFLQLLDEVARDREPITITKRGKVVAQLVPASEPQIPSKFDQVFGRSKGTIEILGDIVSPDWESWGPEWR